MKSLFALLAGLFISFGAVADPQAPDVLIKSVTNEVLDIVRKDKDIQSGNTKKAIELVEGKVLPHFNFTQMTQTTVGPAWRQATPAQRKALTDEFRQLLVRTYSKALTEYKSQTIDFKPFTAKPADTTVIVKSEIKQKGAEAIGLDYRLDKGDDGAWKVVDIKVAGVSLVSNYIDYFKSEISKDGIDGLIKQLQAKNKSSEASVAKK